MTFKGIVLPKGAKLTSIVGTREKFILNRDGKVALSVGRDTEDERYYETINLDGTGQTSWIDKAGARRQPDVIDLEIDELSVSFLDAKRVKDETLSPGSLMVSADGIILVGTPWDVASDTDPVYVDLTARQCVEAQSIVFVLNGWKLIGMRSDCVAFEFEQP